MPVQRPTSCAFGGERLETLFVTSASVGLDQAALAAQPNAGGLFSLERLGTGLPTRCFGALAADPFPAGGQA
jgi:sugar lactone lactonase YvrE